MPRTSQFAHFITSLLPIIIVMLMFIAGMIFETQSLLHHQVLPPILSGHMRIFAAWFIAIGFEMSVLITSVNGNLLAAGRVQWVHWVFALSCVVVNLFFFDTFSAYNTTTEVVMKVFFSLLIGSLNVVYTTLFVRKWAEVKERDTLMEQVARTTEQIELVTQQRAHTERMARESKAAQEQRESEMKRIMTETVAKAKQIQTEYELMKAELHHLKNEEKIKTIKRTLYLPNAEPLLCDNMQQLNGKMNGKSEDEKEYHRAMQYRMIQQIEQQKALAEPF